MLNQASYSFWTSLGDSITPTTPAPKSALYQTAFNLTVLVAGLGYFVDTFDFFLYNSMRFVSLTEMGLSGEALTKTGILILNSQILGALFGSFFWGILGDKKGRKSALLGSILLYSLGMVANGFVHDVVSYTVIRFLIGFGVAGEVGLGATLVAETIHGTKRTYALAFFTILGVLGVAAAGLSIEWVGWRTGCFIGGGIGLLLLALRSVLAESSVFLAAAETPRRRGSLRDLFGRAQNLKRYLLCVPVLGANFFHTGILLTLAPEIARANGVLGTAKANIALAIYFSAAAFGDAWGAWLSNRLQSRRRVAGLFLGGNLCLAFFYLHLQHLSLPAFYTLCAAFGLFNLWAIAGTIVVEQFPTELRATAATSQFNCSRAMVVLMNFAFLALRPLGIAPALELIGAAIFALGLFCIARLPECYGLSLVERKEELFE